MPPNILFLTDDQHRWNWFGGTGAVPTLATPHLDRLRAAGTVLTNAWTNCPICVPTRFTWYSGLHASQGREALLRNACDWPTVPTLPQALQALGYRTAVIGKVHHQERTRDLATAAAEARTRALGFDEVWEVGGRSLAFRNDCHWTRHLAAQGLLAAYRGDLKARRAAFCWNETYAPGLIPTEHQVDTLIADRCVAWLRSHDGRSPFFLHASLCGPHFPLDPPPEYFARYHPDDMPDPAGVDDPEVRAYWREQRAAYCGLISLVDDQAGRILAALDQSGRAADTVVVFASDHGDRLGDGGSWHKSQPEDGSCRIPLALRGPGVLRGAACAAFAGCVDIAATLLEIAGDREPLQQRLPSTPGRSLWPLITGGAAAPRQRVYAEHAGFRMIVDATWKYIRASDGSERLHRRADDPDDLRNLAHDPQHAGDLAALRADLIAELLVCIAPNAPGWQHASSAVADLMRAEKAGLDRIPMRPQRR